VIVPLLPPLVLAATLNVTLPLPAPVAPAVIVIHVALLAAAHAQPVVVVTLTAWPVVAPDPTGTVSGFTANEQAAAAD
jgi:hypothetical protein